MDKSHYKLLQDISLAIHRIDFFIGEPRIFKNFLENLMMQQAVERNLEIIGEAVNQLLKLNTDLSITDARRIVDTRNKIIHGYDEIEPENIWNIIITIIPRLKKEVETLLNQD
ncbi:HepT-like ribonuclease domain-containing protein [Pedobacter mendelii]|uniref:Antitoxin n=1 Tax=Pedobacter mendelii TaxID=1908240 RepID=A0ABQ2BC77_9SPHI|nr:HepT-like ribonuclease domain-containing protein [Pedobacter mendelii]GGI22733.1 antitoxin [Pedobacter mendelii]